jgi:hypothetical protein
MGSILVFLFASTVIVISFLMAGHLLTPPKRILNTKHVEVLRASVSPKMQAPDRSVFHVLAEKPLSSAGYLAPPSSDLIDPLQSAHDRILKADR